MGFMRNRGLRVQQQKVLNSLNRVDEFGQAVRRYVVIKWRCYKVPRPNSLWHLDGHHKTIRWGFVVHEIIDGFSRIVSPCVAYLRLPQTHCMGRSLQCGSAPTIKHLPSLMFSASLQGDRGGENVQVAEWMTENQGLNRRSFIWGL